jgi:hypothetical protein
MRYKEIVFKNVEDGISDNQIQLETSKNNIIKGLIDSDSIIPSPVTSSPVLNRLYEVKKTISGVSYSIDEVLYNASAFFIKEGTLFKATLNNTDNHVHLYKLLNDSDDDTFDYVGDAGEADLITGAFSIQNKIVIFGDFVSGHLCKVSEDNGLTWSGFDPQYSGSDILIHPAKPVYKNGKYYFHESFPGFSTNPAYRRIYTTTDFTTFTKIHDSDPGPWEITYMFQFLDDIYIVEDKTTGIGSNVRNSTTKLSRYDEINDTFELIKFVNNVQFSVTNFFVFQDKICSIFSDGRNRRLWMFDGMNSTYKSMEKNQDLKDKANRIYGVSDDYLYWSDGSDDIHVIDKNFSYFRNFLKISDFLNTNEDRQDFIVYQDNIFVSTYNSDTDDERIFHFSSDKIIASGSFVFPTIKNNQIIPKQIILYHKELGTGSKIEIYYSTEDHPIDGFTYTKLGEETVAGATRYVLDFPSGLVFNRITFKVIIYDDTNNLIGVDDLTLKFLYTVKNLDK